MSKILNTAAVIIVTLDTKTEMIFGHNLRGSINIHYQYSITALEY